MLKMIGQLKIYFFSCINLNLNILCLEPACLGTAGTGGGRSPGVRGVGTSSSSPTTQHPSRKRISPTQSRRNVELCDQSTLISVFGNPGKMYVS